MKNYLGFVVAFVFVACSKDDSEMDNKLPVVTISSPDNNQVFNTGATVSVAGTVTDNKQVAELHVHISNRTTGELLIDIHRYPATASYNLNESFQTQSGINYKIQVIAKDNSANEDRATVEVSTN